MNITNELNLPEPLVDAIRNDGYTKGDADFSITGLMSPPYQRKLMGEYGGKITEDAADRIWSLVRQSIPFWREQESQTQTMNWREDSFQTVWERESQDRWMFITHRIH